MSTALVSKIPKLFGKLEWHNYWSPYTPICSKGAKMIFFFNFYFVPSTTELVMTIKLEESQKCIQRATNPGIL